MNKSWLQQLVATIFVAIVLSACGGGGGGGSTVPSANPSPTFTASATTKSALSIDGRRLADVNTSGVPDFANEDLFKWVEQWSKDTNYSFFPSGPSTQTGTFDGTSFAYRDYSTGASIRIRTSDGMVFVRWPDQTIYEVGTLVYYACVVNNCADPATAGDIVFSNDGGTSITLKPNLTGDKVTALGGDDEKGHDIPISKIERVSWLSDRLNNWDKTKGVGFNARMADGTWRVTGIPNNDCGRLVFWSEGKRYWVDFTNARGWKVSGLNADPSQKCGIAYGVNGFTPAKVYARMETDHTATMVWDFGSDFVVGFGTVVFDWSDPARVYAFVLNGDHQGSGYGSGWGLGDGRKTSEGYLITPSVHMTWIESDPVTGNKLLVFKNLACTDKVNATAYQGTGPADKVVYSFGADGFGLSWASVGGEKPFWTAGSGTVIDSVAGQVQYAVPFCTEKK